MKYLKSKCLQKTKGNKIGKYQITLEVTDTDIEMFEDFSNTVAPFKVIEEPSIKNDFQGKYSIEYKKKYLKWINKVWRCFWKLWDHYDE